VQNIVVDAGPLIALFRRRDKYHARVKTAVSSLNGKLVSTLPVITETCHFLNANGKLALLTWVRRGGLTLHPVTNENLADIEVVIQRYADRDIDFADATLIWLASLLNTAEIMTIDRADFEVYRLANGKSFSLLLA
jgi:predicted nucleic acid-binding protein